MQDTFKRGGVRQVFTGRRFVCKIPVIDGGKPCEFVGEGLGVTHNNEGVVKPVLVRNGELPPDQTTFTFSINTLLPHEIPIKD